MNLAEYQFEAMKTAKPSARNVNYMTLGLAGEAGEVANKVKKIIRDFDGEVTPEAVDAIKSELGDVLWYVAGLAMVLDVTLDDVAEANLEKLKSRKARGKIGGSGDNR